MTNKQKALLWGAAIIVTALASVAHGVSDGAAFGIIAGLSGAAIGSLSSRKSSCGEFR